MLSWFLRGMVRKEIKKEIDQIHYILHNSFGNIKQDITELHNSHKNLHNLHSKREEKLDEYEERITCLENYLFNKLKKTEENLIKPEIKAEDHIEEVYESLTHTHHKIFMTLYHLQQQLEGHPISLKSLAKIIYPDKKYTNVRSTLSEYLTFLSTIGLVSKIRQGKESLAKITEIGLDYIQQLKKEGKIKEKKLKIRN